MTERQGKEKQMFNHEGILYVETELGNVAFRISFYQGWPEDVPAYARNTGENGPHYSAAIINPLYDFSLPDWKRQEHRQHEATLTVRGREVTVSGSVVHFGKDWKECFRIGGLTVRKPGNPFPEKPATDGQRKAVQAAIFAAIRRILPDPFNHRLGAEAVRHYCESETERVERETRKLSEELTKLSGRLCLLREAHASGTWPTEKKV